MSSLDKARSDPFGVAIVAALIALALSFGAQRGRKSGAAAARVGDVTALSGAAVHCTLSPVAGRLEIESADGRSRIDLEMSLVVDGIERPLAMRRADVHRKDRSTLVGDLPIELGDEQATGELELRMDPVGDLVTASLAVAHGAGGAAHTYALRLGAAPERRAVFVPGIGEIGDAAKVEARSVVLDDGAHPIALLSTHGPLAIAETEPDTDRLGAGPRLEVSARSERASEGGAPAAAPGKLERLGVSVLVGASSQGVWGRLYQLSRKSVAKVSGVVSGTNERAHVFALDEEGRPLLRALADPAGRFSLEAPTTALEWYAALEAVHTSAPVRFTPGTPWDLRLDVSPGGELSVKVTDADTGQPLVARLAVKGVEGTLDPSFGPDYRASGAGPLMDMLEGEVKTPLPAGRYRVIATKGIEWSVDAQTVEIVSGHATAIELSPRHVVATPGMVGCDLHVHARPSFDSLVTPEDRVLSLVSAGVDFAVPTEHNVVGDYGPALDVQRLAKQLAHVPGVEVTTYAPRFGHFGVFPYVVGAPVPPYKRTTPSALVAAARRGDPSRIVQVNHPRMAQNIGFFNIVGFDPKSERPPAGVPRFDTIEVYNGYELAHRELTERVMRDWFALLNFGRRIAATGSSDSHRIQYQWAGYPRTYALVDGRAAGDTGLPIDTREVIASLKRGRSFVSSGPVIELELTAEGRKAGPGDELPGVGTLGGRLVVRAAPWIDVTSVEVLAGAPPGSSSATVTLFETAIAPRPTRLGREAGSLAEAQARTVRFSTDLSLTPPPGARWVLAVVRGDRKLDDTIPFMGIQPFAFTNPVYLVR